MRLFPTLHAVRRRLIPGSLALLAAWGLADPAMAQPEHGFYVTGGELVYIQGDHLTVGLPENFNLLPQEERHVQVDQNSQIIIDTPGFFNISGDFDNQNPIRNPFAIGATTNGTVVFCNDKTSSNQQLTGNATTYPNLWMLGANTLKTVEADATIWAGGQLTMLTRPANASTFGLECRVLTQRRLHVLNTDPTSVRIKPPGAGTYTQLDQQLNLGFVSTEPFARFIRRTDRTAQYLFPLGSRESPSSDKLRPLFVDPSVNEERDLATRLAWEDASVDPEGPYNREERDTNLCEINPDFFHMLEDENELIQGATPVAYNNLTVRYTQDVDGVWNTLTKHDAPENKWFDTGAPDNASTGSGAYEQVPVWNSGASPIDNLNNPAFALGRYKPVGCFTYEPGPRVRMEDAVTFTSNELTTDRNNPDDFNYIWQIVLLDAEGNPVDTLDNFANGRPVFTETFEEPGRYIVTLVTVNAGSDEPACTEICPDTITVEPRTAFIIPDAFTPGTGDILNEHFTFYFYGFSEAELRIFDRWGLEVWNYTYTNADGAETKPVNTYGPQGKGYWDDKYWNGTYKNDGKPCQEDVYTYSFKAKTLDSGKDYDRKGTITLIR